MSPTFLLPDGTRWHAADQGEAAVLYRTIFVESCYDAAKFRVAEDDLIVDAGANIGLASLYFSRAFPGRQILAVEPAASTHALLKANVDLHDLPVALERCALWRSDGFADFEHYPQMSTMSGLGADSELDSRLSRLYLQNQGFTETGSAELLDGRHGIAVEQVRLRRLSDLLRNYARARIGLVKLDIEGAELAALQGLDESDWARISGFVGELHCRSYRLDEIATLFTSHGFTISWRQDPLLAGTEVWDFDAARI